MRQLTYRRKLYGPQPGPLAEGKSVKRSRTQKDYSNSGKGGVKKWLPISGHRRTTNSFWTKKTWMWRNLLTEKRASLLKITSSLRCRCPTIYRNLAQHVKVRQRVVATAVTYMRRCYTRKSMTEYDPHLVAPTCLYLASKAEESTVQARLLVFYIKKIYSDEKYRYEVKDILEMEMKILEALNYYLVVFHPYRSLVQFLQDAGMNDINMTHLS
ncbi:hypothetical protein CISIN_1g024567mg [Citrus sinensis]|nr:hypothetical protein CISIN_1g024567mg [Citrus sinensis]